MSIPTIAAGHARLAVPPIGAAVAAAGIIRVAILVGAAAIIGSVAGCITPPPPVQPGTTRVVRDEVLETHERRRECVHLGVGDRLDFDWQADRPMSFTLLYYDGKAEIAPINRTGVTADSGVFIPVLEQDYCLRWEAGPAGAVFGYRIRLRAAPR
jgi:hypothetical protein